MSKQFPVSFNFKAFETVSATIDRVNSRLNGLKQSVAGFNNKFAVLQEKTKSWREGMQKVGSSIQSAGKKLTTFVTAPLALLAGKMVHTAIAAEDAAGSFNQVFKSVSEEARNASAQRLSEGMDLATASAQDLMSATGLLANDLGLSGEQSLKLSEDVARLGVQMAGFRNVEGGATVATEILRNAMLGQTKGLKQLGIVLTDAQIKEEARAMAARGARFETVEQAKALATFSLIQKRTTDDIEDFQGGTASMENQLRVAQERFKELSATIGGILQPVVARIFGAFNSLTKAFVKLDPAWQKLAVFAGIAAAALGPLLIALGFLVGTVGPGLITIFSAIASMSLPVVGAFLGIGAAVAGLIAAGVALYKNWESVKAFFLALWDGPTFQVVRFVAALSPPVLIAKALIAVFTKLGSVVVSVFQAIGSAVAWVWENSGIKTLLSAVGKLGQLALFGRGGQFGVETAAPQTLAGGGLVAPGTVGEQAASVGAQAQTIGRTIAQEIRTTNDAKVQIDFTNLPKGVKVGATATGSLPALNLGMLGATL